MRVVAKSETVTSFPMCLSCLAIIRQQSSKSESACSLIKKPSLIPSSRNKFKFVSAVIERFYLFGRGNRSLGGHVMVDLHGKSVKEAKR